MRKYIGFILLAVLVSACEKQNKVEKEIAEIPLEVEVDRFDLAFASSSENDLGGLKAKYPYLFPQQYADSVWLAQMKDTLQLEINHEIAREFPDLGEQEVELRSLFQHLRYYFPEFNTPKVITLTSDVDYRNKVIYTDSLMLVSLDTYLGKDHKFYEGIQNYLRKNFEREMIVSDAVSAFAKSVISFPRSRTFLSWMILYGKELYLKDVLIPFKTDAQKIGYTQEEYDWAVGNESEIWRYFVERNLIFSTDSKLQDRFINPAPFSKFYLELDTESPGQLGQYIGWQIVRAYMENNDVSLQELLRTPEEEIYNNSKFKPKK
ncbi:gliding motility lipoprotein GldB [Leptobacterium flavescens]|uniref:Gliding motility lipoprotein GldB n=1 Tax=Leptobacterium flavescens TaxID=472055 RepID=A0A6P0UGR8_9FLAO|nr:gliding motility lipoprotein GldB [Leptobacterium flavescens]NER12491.1 gliding motility lipoprotein GldB [Leptobacterium flavescens]